MSSGSGFPWFPKIPDGFFEDMHKALRIQTDLLNKALPAFVMRDLAMIPDMSVVQQIMKAQLGGTSQVMQQIMRVLNPVIAEMTNATILHGSVLTSLNAQLDSATRNNAARILAAFPDVSQLTRDGTLGLRFYLRRLEEARLALGECGYPFLAEFADDSQINAALGLSRCPERVRPMHLTNRLLQLTRCAEFRQVLSTTFASSPIVERRSHIVLSAFDAHADRRYALSVPALYAQIDGIVVDILKVRGSVVVDGGRLYAGADGAKKLNKKGKPILIHGAGQALRSASVADTEELQVAKDVLLAHFVPDRNLVAHGDIRYPQAKRSVNAILIIRVLSGMLAELFQDSPSRRKGTTSR